MSFAEQLSSCIHGTVVVIGIGNPMRGDDAAGSLAARSVKELPGVHVIDAQTVPEDYISEVVDHRPGTVIFIDAVELHSAPGSVALLNRDEMASHWPSTHRVPLRILMDYLDHETHARIVLVAIQPGHRTFMRPLTQEVEASAKCIGNLLNQALEKSRTADDDKTADPLGREVTP